jgi:hypothetical protein
MVLNDSSRQTVCRLYAMAGWTPRNHAGNRQAGRPASVVKTYKAAGVSGSLGMRHIFKSGLRRLKEKRSARKFFGRLVLPFERKWKTT